MEFENKVVVVTGAASGIGYLTAEKFALDGAKTAMLGPHMDKLQDAAEKIRALGGDVYPYEVDVRDYGMLESAIDDLYSKFGRIDVTVSCAGGASSRVFGRTESFKDMPIDVIDWGIDVNFKGPLYMARAVMKYMTEQKSGVIINIGSITGQTGGNCIDYSASKSGVMNGLTKSLALYGAPYGVRCCCVSPGPVLTRPAMANMRTPLGRAAEPIEIVNMILYLASEKAAFITGTNYLVDGGRACGAKD